jgi:hypothetical protein
MKIDDRLKKIIFKKLANDLSHVEVIPYEDSIWFIDRDKKYWYLELENDGTLWWRHDFFDRFFQAFSLKLNDYVPLIVEWVEEVLNRKVLTTTRPFASQRFSVEEVLNRKVLTTRIGGIRGGRWVEQVLNSK